MCKSAHHIFIYRYIRAQKTHEKLSTLPLKNLKKKDKAAWRFMQVNHLYSIRSMPDSVPTIQEYARHKFTQFVHIEESLHLYLCVNI